MDDLGIRGGWLTVNRFCNFRCRWCYALGTSFKPEDNMPLDMAISLIDLMHSLGVQNVVLIGGETLFWRHLFPVATYIKSLGMTSAVVTNGWLLGHERFRRKVERSDITSINISVKAGNKQQYIELARFDGYDRVAEAIRETSIWSHIGVSTSTVISTAVLHNLDEVVRFAFANGARSMNMSVCGPAISNGEFDTQYVPEIPAMVDSFVSHYPAMNEVSGGNISIEASLPACVWPKDFLATMEDRDQITYGCHFKTRSGVLFDRWGKIIPCNHLFDYPLGQFGVDFTDTEGFATLWNNPEVLEFYDKMIAYPASACIKCGSFDKCGGGCPLNWFVREPESVIPAGGCS